MGEAGIILQTVRHSVDQGVDIVCQCTQADAGLSERVLAPVHEVEHAAGAGEVPGPEQRVKSRGVVGFQKIRVVCEVARLRRRTHWQRTPRDNKIGFGLTHAIIAGQCARMGQNAFGRLGADIFEEGQDISIGLVGDDLFGPFTQQCFARPIGTSVKESDDLGKGAACGAQTLPFDDICGDSAIACGQSCGAIPIACAQCFHRPTERSWPLGQSRQRQRKKQG